MKRRDFIGLLGCTAGSSALWPLAAQAQAPAAKRVGVLIPYPKGDKATEAHLVVFRDALAQLGWKDNGNLKINIRWADADAGDLPAAANELVALNPDAILVRSTFAALALRNATRTIPIIFVVVSDPVGDGLVESIARPRGNVTGFSNVEASLGGKWVELLKEVAPQVTRVAVVFGRRTATGGGAYYLRLIESAAAKLKLTVTSAPVDDTAAIERVIEDFAREPGGGLLVAPDATTSGHRAPIIALAARHRIPAIYPFRFFVDEGGLASYGVEVSDLYRRAAGYVDRILRGDKPADLPVQAPTKFELVINNDAAKALGLVLPATLLARADEVIE